MDERYIKDHKGTKYWTWGTGMTISGHRWNLECKPCCKDVKVQLDRLIFHKALSYFADSDHQPNEAIWTTPRASGLHQARLCLPDSWRPPILRATQHPRKATWWPTRPVVAQTFRRQTWDWLELPSRIVKRMFHWTRGPWELRDHHRHCWLFSPHQDQGLNLWFAGPNKAFKT